MGTWRKFEATHELQNKQKSILTKINEIRDINVYRIDIHFNNIDYKYS